MDYGGQDSASPRLCPAPRLMECATCSWHNRGVRRILQTRVLLAVITVVGVCLTAAGALVDDSSYSSSVLANLGTTVFLAIPLLLLERMFERRMAEAQNETDRALVHLDERVGRVQESVADVSDQLAEVARRTSRRIDENRARDEAELLSPVRSILNEPSYDSVVSALKAADERRAIARWRGIGGGSWTSVSMSFPDFVLNMTLYKAGRTHHGAIFAERLGVSVSRSDRSLPPVSIAWPPEWSVEDCFVEIDRRLRESWGSQAPEAVPGVILARLAGALDLALRRKMEVGPTRRWALIGVLTENWFASTDGLEHVQQGFVAPVNRSDSGARVPKVPEGLSGEEELPFAWSAARRLLETGASSLDWA